MEDSYRHKGMRKRLLRTLEDKGINAPEVLNAMYQIPRHFFMDKAFEELAYEDKALPILEKQTISQPYTVAYQTSLLQVKKRQSILEIGTGSGYQSAVLAAMGARVYTIERHEQLYEFSKKMFKKLGLLHIRSFFKDGYLGLGEFAPFDGIIVTCAAAEIPNTFLDQLKVGGKLVIPVGDENHQQMLRISKLEKGQFRTEKFDRFRFVPFLKGKNPIK